LALRPSGGQPRHCGERLITDDDAVRISIARRSAFKRLPAFKRAAASIRLEFFELLALFEGGIVIFPPGPGLASSSKESNSSELLTLITLPAGEGGGILVLLGMLPPGTGVLAGADCGGTAVPVGMLPPVVSLTGEAGPNDGAMTAAHMPLNEISKSRITGIMRPCIGLVAIGF